MQLIRRLWNGEEKLWKVFWLGAAAVLKCAKNTAFKICKYLSMVSAVLIFLFTSLLYIPNQAPESNKPSYGTRVMSTTVIGVDAIRHPNQTSICLNSPLAHDLMSHYTDIDKCVQDAVNKTEHKV